MPTLIDSLRESLRLHAHRSAVEGAHWLLSFRDLERESDRLAAVLRSGGVGPGHLVPMLMKRSPQFIIAMLAVLRCGAAYAPIDLASPPARQRAMLQALSSPLAVADAGLDLAVLDGRPALIAAELLQAGAQPDAPAADRVPWPDTPDTAPAYAMFTSGSTGAPKCVVVPHSGIRRLVVGTDFADFGPDARWTQLASLAFDAATLEIWGPLLNGACCVVQELPLPSLDDLADYLIERQITDAWLTAALFNAMVDDRIDALGGLKQLMIGGERISVAHSRTCLRRWPGLRLINGYGPTENTTFSLCHTITLADVDDSGRSDAAAMQVPIGRPIRGTVARVMPLSAAEAEESGITQPGAGELLVAGEGVAIGYLNDPVLTAAKFIERDGERWYRTGDVVARRPDGVYEFFGRADRQVKIQGHRIELEEVERVLANCPGVGNAVVLVQGDSAETRHLVGCYSGMGGPPPAETAVRDFLLERLSPKAVPNALHAFERMPLNLNGKVDRPSLAQRLATLGPAAGRQPADDFQTETERSLAAIWARGLPPMRLGRASHFTQAGGSSLLALRVAAEVGRSLGRQLDALDVLRHPVLADQARLIDAAGPFQPAELMDERGRRGGGSGPRLSRSQQSLLQASRLDASGAAYLVHVALQFDDRLPPQRLRAALEALAARHPALRTAAGVEGDAVSTRVLDAPPAGWWRELGPLPAAPTGHAWPEALSAAINAPWNLAVAGPMRASVWSLPEGRHLCVWTVHHFAMDEASIAIALTELDALLAGRELPAVYGSPFGFAAVESAWTDDAALRTQAAGVARALAAQVGRPALLPPAPGPGGERPLPLGNAVAALPLQAAARWRCTPFTPLTVAWGLALQQVFGEDWRFVLTPFSRRVEPALMEPIGCLLDVRLVEAGARRGEALADTLARVHAELLEGQQASFRPFDRLADAVGAIEPALRSTLTHFAITWRPQRQAAVELAGVPVQLPHVPQRGARFGVTLHAALGGDAAVTAHLEAVDAVLADGRAQALADAFAEQLERVCAVPECRLAPRPAAAAATPALPAEAAASVREHAARAWQRWLGRAPRGDDDDFLGAGGSSLLAMRMAAGLRREAGLHLDVAAFLAQPSFGALSRGAVVRGPADAQGVTLVGARNFERVLLILPGGEGGPLGMFKLAQELHGRLPETWAVAIADLPSIMQRAPEGERSAFFAQQLLQVVRDLGESRVGAILGFSLGGLLGIDLLNELPPPRAGAIRLWLLDTYAPQRMRLGKRALLTRVAINLLRHPVDTLGQIAERLRLRYFGGTPANGASLRDAGIGDAAPEWRDFMGEMSRRRFDARRIHATLIHSRTWARSSGLLRNIGTNGFAPQSFGSLQVLEVDDPHYELPRSGAARVAQLVASRTA